MRTYWLVAEICSPETGSTGNPSVPLVAGVGLSCGSLRVTQEVPGLAYNLLREVWDRTRLDGTDGARIWTGQAVLAHNLVKISALAG